MGTEEHAAVGAGQSEGDADDREGIRTLSAEIRRTLGGVAISDDLAAAITRALTRVGEHAAYAGRSSATAEDAVLRASRDLPSAERFDERTVDMAVVVQQMVFRGHEKQRSAGLSCPVETSNVRTCDRKLTAVERTMDAELGESASSHGRGRMWDHEQSVACRACDT